LRLLCESARSNPSLHLTFASRLRRLSPAGELKRYAAAHPRMHSRSVRASRSSCARARGYDRAFASESTARGWSATFFVHLEPARLRMNRFTSRPSRPGTANDRALRVGAAAFGPLRRGSRSGQRSDPAAVAPSGLARHNPSFHATCASLRLSHARELQRYAAAISRTHSRLVRVSRPSCARARGDDRVVDSESTAHGWGATFSACLERAHSRVNRFAPRPLRPGTANGSALRGGAVAFGPLRRGSRPGARIRTSPSVPLVFARHNPSFHATCASLRLSPARERQR